MKLREDQERLQGLLKETITLLCKNGLHFKKNFQVKALIGITTDDDSLFMVDINETVGEATDGIDGDDSQLDSSVRSGGDGRSRGSRKRPPDNATPGSASKRNRTEDDFTDDESDADISGVKREGDDEDLMFVKQEGTDYESHQYSGTGNDFDTSSHDGSTAGQQWSQNPANMDPNQMALAAQSQSGSQQVCTIYFNLIPYRARLFSALSLSCLSVSWDRMLFDLVPSSNCTLTCFETKYFYKINAFQTQDALICLSVKR